MQWFMLVAMISVNRMVKEDTSSYAPFSVWYLGIHLAHKIILQEYFISFYPLIDFLYFLLLSVLPAS